MSRFHSSVRDLFEDVHHFLIHTLKNEVLSSSSLTHREKLLIQLFNLQKDYPELLLKFSPVVEEKNAPDILDPNRHPPSSPVPYVDMNGGSPYKIPSFFPSAPPSDISYDVPLLKDRSESHSITESDDYVSDDAKSLQYVSAAELASCEKAGYLDKKKRETIKGWLNPFQRRWCAIKDGVLYYYEKTTDRKQRGSISLNGYEVRTVSEDNNDAKKYSHCFELVCPGRRTYQFSASSEKELNQWISVIERNSKTAFSGKIAETNHFIKPQPQIKNSSLFDDCEDIYETVLEETDHQDKLKDKISQAAIDEEEYSDIDTVLAQKEEFNYSEWYIGLWDCSSDDQSELSFSRGDLIRIISKEHDPYAWWIGELNGITGFVPKSYLMEAYETY